LHEASPLGVIGGDIQGFPNGRRLADDVVDIEILALAGVSDAMDLGDAAALADGDGVRTNDNEFGDVFPYVAGPNTQAVNQTGGNGRPDDDNGNGNGGGGAGAVAAAAGGSGGPGGLVIPALTGGAALLLIGAGGISLLRERKPRRRPVAVPEA
jgi:hypothetical protein